MVAANVLGVEGNGVDTLVAGEENSPLVVEVLRNDGDLAQAEYFLRANDGIEGVEAGVIANDVAGRNAGGD